MVPYTTSARSYIYEFQRFDRYEKANTNRIWRFSRQIRNEIIPNTTSKFLNYGKNNTKIHLKSACVLPTAQDQSLLRFNSTTCRLFKCKYLYEVPCHVCVGQFAFSGCSSGFLVAVRVVWVAVRFVMVALKDVMVAVRVVLEAVASYLGRICRIWEMASQRRIWSYFPSYVS